MKNRCLMLVCGGARKTDKFVSNLRDVLIDIGDDPLLPIDVSDIKVSGSNVPEMLEKSDALIIVYKDGDNADGTTYTKDDIWETVNTAELSGKTVCILYPDKEYKSLQRYLMEALDHEM